MYINLCLKEMPRPNVLSYTEQKDFDNPTKLSGEERKLYFRINNSMRALLASVRSQTNRVSFVLMLYHFKISKKFFLTHTFSSKDIDYVSRQLGVYDLKHTQCNLGRQVYYRYKKRILEHAGYHAFDQNAKELLRSKTYNLAIQYIRPKVIFNNCVELLLE